MNRKLERSYVALFASGLTGRNIELRHVVKRFGDERKKMFPAPKKFANWKKLLTAEFSWAILEQEIRKKPLVCLAFVSCRVCPASRNVEITAACHERKNYFRAQRVFDWKRMFTAESTWAILEQEIRILSCRSWPLRSAGRTVPLRHVVKLRDERKTSFSRLRSLRIGRK